MPNTPLYNPLLSINYVRGLNFSRTPLAPDLAGYLAEGSWNTLFLGDGYFKPFRGLSSQGNNTGSRVMRPIGRTWGGIKDVGATRASGNVIEDIGRSLWGIGSGQVHVAGTPVTGFTLSTLLKLSQLASGVYQPPVTAGLPQPSAPGIGVSTDVGKVNGAVSAKIEVWRPATGGRSRASNTSAVVIPQGNKIRLTFPLIGAGTHWRVYFTLQKFGGEGIHYALAYNGSLDIPESVVAAGSVDGIARSLLFDWQDGDLVAIEASYDDYSPQAGTHLVKLNNVMLIGGSLADSVTSPTPSDTGTAIQVSKPNNYESYIPTHLLFLPEQIVDVLARPIDEYALVACENSIHAIQYVGPRGDELPACTLTTLLPDIGIKYPHNWTHFRGRVCIYTAEGNLLLMTPAGEIDTEFAARMRQYMRNWDPAETIVGYCPKNDCLVVGRRNTLLIYSLETGEVTAAFLPDYGFSAHVLACQSAERRLFISLTDDRAYEFDAGALNPVPVSFVSHFTNAPNPAAVKNIYQLGLSVQTNTESPIVVCIGTNLRPVAARVNTGASNRITSDAKFNPEQHYLQFAIFGRDIGGPGVPYIKGFLQYVDAENLDLVDELMVPVVPAYTATDLLMFVGDFIGVETANRTEHLSDFFPVVPDARSYSVGIWFLSNDDTASVIETTVYGSLRPSTRI